MTAENASRVQEARQRLKAAESLSGSADSAIRLVELKAPRPGERPLQLHRAFSVVSGLTEGPRQALDATVEGIRLDNNNMGLSAIVETYGRQISRLALQRDDESRSALPARQLSSAAAARSKDARLLIEVVTTIDRAVKLSQAELRGAESAATEASVTEETPPEAEGHGLDRSAVPGAAVAALSEDEEMLRALDTVAPPVGAIDELAQLTEQLANSTDRTHLEAKLSQARASREQLLPGDGRDAAVLAELAIAEADGALAEYDMMPGSPTELITSRLADLGFAVAPFEAAEVAERLIRESAELESIRARLVKSIDSARISPEVRELETHRQNIDARRLRIQRRIRSQQQLMAVTIAEVNRLGVDPFAEDQVLDLRDEPVRSVPILVEEPLADLPAHLSGAVLSVLLRHSARAQVICVSDQADLRQWCDVLGDRVEWVDAEGWFGGGHH